MLKECVEAEAPDLVAFTGDIIDAPHDLLHNTGDSNDRNELIEAVRADYRTMRKWLDELGRPWMIAPGNHDFRPVFLEIFADAPRRLELTDLTAISYYDWEVQENTAERLREERARFDAALMENRPEGWAEGWIVHLQHFLIWPNVPHGYPMRYREADQLRDLLHSASSRHMVLSGHFHAGTEIVNHGNGYYAVCKSITEAPHHYRLFDFTAEGCQMRTEQLLRGPLADRRIVLIDRTDILTDEPSEASSEYALKKEADALFEQMLEAGFQPVLVSAWNDPHSQALAWSEILKRHDRLFLALSRRGLPQGAGLVIAIDENRPLPPQLPFEPLPRYAELAPRIASQYGIKPDELLFLSRDSSRRERFGLDRSMSNIEELLSRSLVKA